MYVVVTQLDEVKTVKIRFMRFMSHWGKTVADTLLRTRSHTHTHMFPRLSSSSLHSTSNFQ